MKTEQQTIDTVLCLISKARRLTEMSTATSRVPLTTEKTEYDRALAEVDEMPHAESLVMLVRHYESRIARLESENGRTSIIKEALRDVLREERDGDVR